MNTGEFTALNTNTSAFLQCIEENRSEERVHRKSYQYHLLNDVVHAPVHQLFQLRKSIYQNRIVFDNVLVKFEFDFSWRNFNLSLLCNKNFVENIKISTRILFTCSLQETTFTESPSHESDNWNWWSKHSRVRVAMPPPQEREQQPIGPQGLHSGQF